MLTLYPGNSITLTSTPSTSLTGTLVATSSSGTASYSGLKLITAGSNTLTASASSCTSASYVLTISAPTVTSLSMSVSNSLPSAFFDFTVTVLIFDQDGNIFTSSASVILTPASLGGTLTGTTSTGSVGFTVYAVSAGSLTITATCSTKTTTSTITVEQNLIKITSVSPLV